MHSLLKLAPSKPSNRAWRPRERTTDVVLPLKHDRPKHLHRKYPEQRGNAGEKEEIKGMGERQRNRTHINSVKKKPRHSCGLVLLASSCWDKPPGSQQSHTAKIDTNTQT